MIENQVSLRPLSELRQRHSSKWRRYPNDVLPMHVAEMDYEIADSIKALLIDLVDKSDLGYTGPVPEVANGFASFAERHWGWTVDKTQVRLATDVGVAAVEVLRALTKPGESVLINSPVYSSFYGWIGELGLTVVDAPLIPGAKTWTLDVTAIEAAFEAGVKFYLLCSPHNPMGRVHSFDELAKIAELAKTYGVTVISDEIHAPLTYPESKFTPYLAVSEAARETGVVITAASKSFNLAGLKAAIIVSQNEAVALRLKAAPEALHWRSGLLGALSMAEAFENCDGWLATTVAANQASRDRLTGMMAELLPDCGYWVAEGGYLAWLDLESLNLGDNPAERILREQKVAFVPGVDLGKSYPQFVRINFACADESLEQAIRAIASYKTN